MHDRRIDGVPHTFGNAGALFMTAMTWWDHETQSIWSQPWGRAIRGTYKGVELFLLPSQVTSWESWRTEHPDTLAMINDMQRLGSRRQTFSPDFVIGLLLAGEAKAYYFRDAAMQGVINDRLGPAPIVVWAQEDNFHAYIRQVGERTLTFSLDGEALVDDETGSIWDIARGRAVEGPLSGEVLQPVPGSTAFDWAWEDFYPDTTFYTP
ncbi:MAG: DUF3179 domain-containing protein [Anaerolineales bacterium]|nr:DUF3179 domain-containing protein [Anaerolineales bacterium]